MLLKQLLEDIGAESPDKIANDVYRLAEVRIADLAAEQGGRGFDRNAIAAEVDKILVDVKARVHEILKRG